MDWWEPVRQLQDRVRHLGSRGRLLVIPTVLAGLVPHLVAVAVFLATADRRVWAEQIPWINILLKALLGVGTPIGLAMVWRYSKPTQRVLSVYDWLGGGLLCISVVWLGNIAQEVVNAPYLGPWGRFLLPFGTAVWGGVGIGLMIAGTAYLSDELRTESQERQRLEALMEFTRRITGLDYQSSLEEAVRQLERLLQADSGILFLWDEPNQVLAPVADVHDQRVYSEEYIRAVKNLRPPMGFGLAGWVMQVGEPYLSGDLAADPHDPGLPGVKTGARSALLAPIQVEGRRLGVISLTREGLHQFTQDDLHLAMSFASQIALVVEHGRIVKELSDLTITDSLTGLFNARHFHQVLEVEVRRTHRYNQPLSLVMTDSDSLKKVNDLLGHQRGDEHLKNIGRVLKSFIRLTDYAFRYAGDEFLLLLPNTDASEALVVGERVRLMAEAQEAAEGLCTTVSVGVATIPIHAADGEGLLAAADQAMYQSKRAGKNHVTQAREAWAGKRS